MSIKFFQREQTNAIKLGLFNIKNKFT
jgi:hypothetical protein